MAAQALYRRWRPQDFDDVVGQQHIVRTLANAVATDRLAHAYLFTGLRGTGKTSVARILAKAINCVGDGTRPCNECSICISITEARSLDLIEIDAASNTGVDDVRDLREKIGFAPSESRFKVYIIDEVHMLSMAAFNALLKTLEEPPPHALFILATTEPHKIPETIMSRCQRHDFRRVAVVDVAAKLRRICEAEAIEADDAALERIARAGTGSLRDAESLLDQVVATGESLTLERVRDILGVPGGEAVAGLVDDVIAGEAGNALRRLGDTIDHGADPAQLQARLLEHLRQILLVQTGVDDDLLDLPDEQIAHLRRQAAAWPTVNLVATIHRVTDARPTPDRAQPTLPLELALVESVLDATSGSESASTTAPPGRRPEAQAKPVATPVASTEPAATVTDAGSSGTSTKADATVANIESAVTSTKPGATVNEVDSSASSTKPSEPLAEADSSVEPPFDAAKSEGSVPEQGDTPPSGASAPAAGGGQDGLAMLRRDWEAIVTGVAARDRNTAALLKDCRPVAVDGDDVVLGFFYEFHCKRAAEPARSAVISQVIASVLGTEPRLRLTVVPASDDDRKSRPRSKTERAGGDPVVRHAIEELGGRIAGVRAEPEDDA